MQFNLISPTAEDSSVGPRGRNGRDEWDRQNYNKFPQNHDQSQQPLRARDQSLSNQPSGSPLRAHYPPDNLQVIRERPQNFAPPPPVDRPPAHQQQGEQNIAPAAPHIERPPVHQQQGEQNFAPPPAAAADRDLQQRSERNFTPPPPIAEPSASRGHHEHGGQNYAPSVQRPPAGRQGEQQLQPTSNNQQQHRRDLLNPQPEGRGEPY